MRTFHVRYVGLYSVAMAILAIVLRGVQIEHVSEPVVMTLAGASVVAFAPMKLCFKGQDFLQLGRLYVSLVAVWIAAMASMALYLFVKLSASQQYGVPVQYLLLGASVTALTLYYLPARAALRTESRS